MTTTTTALASAQMTAIALLLVPAILACFAGGIAGALAAGRLALAAGPMVRPESRPALPLPAPARVPAAAFRLSTPFPADDVAAAIAIADLGAVTPVGIGGVAFILTTSNAAALAEHAPSGTTLRFSGPGAAALRRSVGLLV